MIKKRFKQLMVKRGQCLTVVLFFPEVFLWSYGIKQPSNACYFIFCGSAGTTPATILPSFARDVTIRWTVVLEKPAPNSSASSERLLGSLKERLGFLILFAEGRHFRSKT